MKKALFIGCFLVVNSFALTQEGLPGVHKTMSAKTLMHGNLSIGIAGDIATDARVIDNGGAYTLKNSSTTNYYTSNSLNSLGGYMFFALGLSNYFDFSLMLPVYWDDWGLLANQNIPQLGDFRYRFKVQIPYPAEFMHVVDGALFLGGVLPTAEKGIGVVPRSIENFSMDPTMPSPIFGQRKAGLNYGLNITVDFGELEEKFQLKWHLNIGERRTFDSNVDDVLFYSAALDYRMVYFLSGFVEYYHETRMDVLGSSNEFNTEPTTINVGGTLHSPVGIDITMGLSFGLNTVGVDNKMVDRTGNWIDYKVKSTTPLSAFVGLHWNGWLIPQDDDKDGILNKRDACPNVAEDMDGHKDYDGCPEDDNDEDGIKDNADACPNQPEDADGFQDDDGCPDADNDQDGVPDLKDGCPLIAEDIDGFEDADGCAELDNDRDGVSDSVDNCPMVAEDIDGFEDEDGCADIDNDKDGIIDAKDKCPNTPETVNGVEDEDGCPDNKAAPIKNVTLHGVNFKTGSAELTFESFQVLDKVVEQLLAYPEVEIEISGHTDNVGDAKANQRLSESRSQSVVNYFISKGVARSKLRAVGYGETKPIASNRKADGREQNRRIEMYRIK